MMTTSVKGSTPKSWKGSKSPIKSSSNNSAAKVNSRNTIATHSDSNATGRPHHGLSWSRQSQTTHTDSIAPRCSQSWSGQSQTTPHSLTPASTHAHNFMKHIRFELMNYKVLKPLRKTEPTREDYLPTIQALLTERTLNDFEKEKRTHPDDVKYELLFNTIRDFLKSSEQKPVKVKQTDTTKFTSFWR